MASPEEPPEPAWIPNPADSFGARLALVRQHMRWGNVKEAADACHLPAESWRGWERDNREPRSYVESCRTISAATGVDLIWLMTGHARNDRPGRRGPGKPVSGMRSSPTRLARHSTAISHRLDGRNGR